uniref:Uncharacterized protein n=1 Tax=Bradyrhizobium amphicarpaeae TaxID=1404768 RepID=A0A2U8Q181_9BRAD|nr:hypothetical protein CIT40_30000 [Bradyrhizobium amphicarpaeae]
MPGWRLRGRCREPAERASHSAVMPRLGRGIQNAAASRFISAASGILDHRFAGDDTIRAVRAFALTPATRSSHRRNRRACCRWRPITARLLSAIARRAVAPPRW